LSMTVKPERVFISVDMEGISGIVDPSQTGGDPKEYDYGRKLMAGDVNAAIEGALTAGVKEVVVSDAHGGGRNIQPEDLNEAAILVRGTPKPFTMMEGIGGEFDAALYVGYHSMKGTENGILAHTISGNVVDAVHINGRETGEFGLNAALAGWHGVASVFISGDAAVAEEARSFVPEVKAAVVKWAVGRHAARCLHPNRARTLIRKTVAEALANVEAFEPYWVKEPVEVRLRFNREQMADLASFLPYLERLDGKTVRGVFDDYPTAFRGLRAAIYVAGTT
jgi:D-amino peptidase